MQKHRPRGMSLTSPQVKCSQACERLIDPAVGLQQRTEVSVATLPCRCPTHRMRHRMRHRSLCKCQIGTELAMVRNLQLTSLSGVVSNILHAA